MTVNLKTHRNIAKSLVCQNRQEKDIMATKRQNAMKHEDFFNLYCSLKMLAILNLLPKLSSYSPPLLLPASMIPCGALSLERKKKLNSTGLMIFYWNKAYLN